MHENGIVRPVIRHAVLAGRRRPPEPIAAADAVTGTATARQASATGVAAQEGVEW